MYLIKTTKINAPSRWHHALKNDSIDFSKDDLYAIVVETLDLCGHPALTRLIPS
jgi:hypothetical protein